MPRKFSRKSKSDSKLQASKFVTTGAHFCAAQLFLRGTNSLFGVVCRYPSSQLDDDPFFTQTIEQFSLNYHLRTFFCYCEKQNMGRYFESSVNHKATIKHKKTVIIIIEDIRGSLHRIVSSARFGQMELIERFESALRSQILLHGTDSLLLSVVYRYHSGPQEDNQFLIQTLEQISPIYYPTHVAGQESGTTDVDVELLPCRPPRTEYLLFAIITWPSFSEGVTQGHFLDAMFVLKNPPRSRTEKSYLKGFDVFWKKGLGHFSKRQLRVTQDELDFRKIRNRRRKTDVAFAECVQRAATHDTSAMSRKSTDHLTQDVAKIDLYNPKPMLLHGYVLPFVVLYAIWLGYWTSVLGVTDYLELGLIVTAIIGVLQILTCLFCHWFVGFKCLVTCYKELSTGASRHYFYFQRLKYNFLNEDKDSISEVNFPVDWKVCKYLSWRGYETTQDVLTAEESYGHNE
ncbi:cation-transporting ATPase 13A1 [Clonorchis sinensis]|uniref:Cation-transporting ATPase 13A1 n=1 Tax=Clonorchis sinensis TaxID=79923 RepID=G7YUA5_CLOSI|nr:cation-transporting ATPase 13A1 [Clonorchis sinensis]